MDSVTLFIAQPQASLIEEPGKGRFNDVAVFPEPTAMFGSALGDQGCHFALTQWLTNLLLGIVGTIRKHFLRTLTRPTARLLDTRNPIDQGNGHLRFVHIGPRVLDGQGRSLPVHDQMAFGAVLAPIRGIRAGLGPPKSARTEQLSIAEVHQSMPSACPNSSSRTSQIFCQTPAACRSRKRRQQVMPQPQPISWGRCSHWMPVLSTKRMPVSAARAATGGRPPLGLGGSGGMCGAMRSHSPLVSSGLAMATSPKKPDRSFTTGAISDAPLPFL